MVDWIVDRGDWVGIVGPADWVGIVGLTRSSNADCMGWHNRYIVITNKVGIGDYNIG